MPESNSQRIEILIGGFVSICQKTHYGFPPNLKLYRPRVVEIVFGGVDFFDFDVGRCIFYENVPL